MIHWIKTHDLLMFFVLTFLLTFGGRFLAIISGVGTLADIGLWGPALAAILVSAVTREKAGLKDLFRRMLLWKVPARWYLVIFLGWPAISILASLVYAQITNQPIRIQWDRWSGFQTWLPSALVLGLWACEEIGWRGFALPRLLERWNALFSSIVLGMVWAFWHLPYFLGMNGISSEFFVFPVLTITLSILMTWIWNHTRGSLFVATFFHFWVNAYGTLQADKLTLSYPGGEILVQYLLLTAAAVIVVLLYGYRSFTRQQPNLRTSEL